MPSELPGTRMETFGNGSNVFQVFFGGEWGGALHPGFEVERCEGKGFGSLN